MTEHLERLARLQANLQRRAAVIEGIRTFFRRHGFLEVDTPILMPAIIPERYIEPFIIEGHYLSTSPELYMKQLLASGYGRIFQLCHSFRRGERGSLHQPEFTMLEWYRAGAGYMDIIHDTENLVVALSVNPVVWYRGQAIDLTPPWRRITVRDAFLKWAGWDPVRQPEPGRFDVDLVERVIPALGDKPAVLMDYPASESSLSRLKPGDRLVAERAEVFIAGLEIANAYSELTDASEQEARFCKEIEHLEGQGKCGFTLPRRLLDAIRRMPESGGVALGVDRLVMLLCDAASIEDVVAFPWETSGDS